MKKIKLLLVLLLMVLSFAVTADINAAETTQEPTTTEEATTTEAEEVAEEATLPPLDNQLFSDAKDWITAGIAAIVSWLFGGGAIYLIMRRYERKALAEVEKAVAANELSQEQGALAVATVQKTATAIEDKLKSFEERIDDKVGTISDQSTSVSEKMDKINDVINTFGEAVETFLIEDEEV